MKDMIDTVICGDCLEVMRGMEDNSVDLVLTDPPYGIGLKYDVYKDTDANWNDMFMWLIPEIKRISSMAVLPCCQIKKLPFIYTNYPPDWLICWYKGSPGHRAYVGFNDWEPLLVYGKTKGCQMHDYFHCSPTPFDNGHPCPKPVDWAKWLISRCTKEGDTVLDCFAGSGTTCIAAKTLNRYYIGIDLSETYCQIARLRLSSFNTGVPLKEAMRGQMALFNE